MQPDTGLTGQSRRLHKRCLRQRVSSHGGMQSDMWSPSGEVFLRASRPRGRRSAGDHAFGGREAGACEHGDGDMGKWKGGDIRRGGGAQRNGTLGW